jgi:hypothetical protein
MQLIATIAGIFLLAVILWDGFETIITVLESGTGIGFLAIVISYLPVLYGAFSRREVNISLLDARAGSPPTAAELVRRHVRGQNLEALGQFLRDWEAWSAELMESHLSFPVLCYFRSQHDNQSWLAALTAVLDTCALLITCAEGALQRLLMPYPAWKAAAGPADNWKTSAWERISSESSVAMGADMDEEHR